MSNLARHQGVFAFTQEENGMRISKMIAASLLMVLALVGLNNNQAQAQSSDRYGKQKVVYHINYAGGDEDRAYRGALTNIQNHIDAVGRDNIEVNVVLHGDGVGILKSAVSNEQIQMAVTNLKGQNVAFRVCNNTLTGRNIDYEEDLFEVFESDIVPSGVAELSYLQQDGFTYIKP